MLLPIHNDERTSISSTFLASLQSIGTAVTMAFVGWYLQHTGLMGKSDNNSHDGKKTLAVIAQQVLVPLFLFTKMIDCKQDESDEPCPDVTQSLSHVRMLLWCPAYVVAVGLGVGYMVALVCGTPRHLWRSVLVACAFGNSNSLPIALLQVIHDTVPTNSDLARVDPTLFVPPFLLLYPMLQWGLGSWLLSNECFERGSNSSVEMDDDDDAQRAERQDNADTELVSLVAAPVPASVATTITTPRNQSDASATPSSWQNVLRRILEQCLQPPVLGSLAGLLVALVPSIRGLLVDLNRHNKAPLQFLFNGLHQVGQAAVPISMMILGCNIVWTKTTTTTRKDGSDDCLDDHPDTNKKGSEAMSVSTMIGIVIGKMIVSPIIGILSVVLLRRYVWQHDHSIPSDMSTAVYLVLMVVFLTPTANNVIVLVQLFGTDSDSDEAAMFARLIAIQYLVAPLILSVSMTIAMSVAATS